MNFSLDSGKTKSCFIYCSITEKICEALDQNNFSCGIFIDLQKAFDTVDKEILLHKLSHYGIRGIANSLFTSYLSNRKQFVSINDGFESEVSDITLEYHKAQC